MKRVHFMPNMLGMVLAATLFVTSSVTAQEKEKVFAYHSTAPAKTSAAEKEAPTPFKMHIKQMGKDSLVFRVSVENPGADRLLLLIRDERNNTLHRETIPATPVFVGRYNLQSLEDGNYVFELRSGKQKLAEKAVDIKTQLSVNRMVAVEE